MELLIANPVTNSCCHPESVWFGKLNIQFQKISIPTPWKVNGNSEGVEGLKEKILKGKYGA